MDQRGVAAGKKNASRLKAWLVFLDESGLLTSPLVRRTWAPCGQTPILVQRGNSREKASVIAALAISPKRRKVRLLFSLRPGQNVNAVWVIEFLRELTYHLGPRVVVIWDNLNPHRAKLTRQFLSGRKHLRTVHLPAYAPELNPVEYLWAYLKRNPLANWAPQDVDELTHVACQHIERLQNEQNLLRSFLRAGPLFLRLR